MGCASSAKAKAIAEAVATLPGMQSDDESEPDDPDCLYLVFRGRDGKEHAVTFQERGLGLSFAEWAPEHPRVAGFLRKGEVPKSAGEELGVKIGWALIGVGDIDVSEMSTQDALTVLWSRERLLHEERPVRPWKQIVQEEQRQRGSWEEDSMLSDHELFHMNKDAISFPDPRYDSPHETAGILAFNYPGVKSPVDRICNAAFLSNMFENGSDLIHVCRADGSSTFSFSTVEVAYLAMEVWEQAGELRFTCPEDAKHAVEMLKEQEHSNENAPSDGEGSLCLPIGRSLGNDFLGYGSRLRALMAILEAKFKVGTTMGDALVKTGNQFLLYFPDEGTCVEGPHKKRRMLRSSARPDEAVPISESSFDQQGLTNTLGLLLMKVRGYLSSNDDGWSHWIDERCLLPRILAGDRSSQVEFGKITWNRAVERCTSAVKSSIRRRSPTARNSERSEVELPPEMNRGAELAEKADQPPPVLQPGTPGAEGAVAELSKMSKVEARQDLAVPLALFRTSADAGISVFAYPWLNDDASQLKELPPPEAKKEHGNLFADGFNSLMAHLSHTTVDAEAKELPRDVNVKVAQDAPPSSVLQPAVVAVGATMVDGALGPRDFSHLRSPEDSPRSDTVPPCPFEAKPEDDFLLGPALAHGTAVTPTGLSRV